MVTRLLPAAGPTAVASDEDLLAWYAPPAGNRPHVRFNFVTTADGAATSGGLSGGLGTPADKRIFALLRRQADVILVGAGTVRAEGYSGPLLDAAGTAWRLAAGMPGHPAFAVVSARLDLDPRSDLFSAAPVRPLILTAAGADAGRRAALSRVAEVIDAGATTVEPGAAVAALAARGHRIVHSEGGPRLFGAFQAAGAVDELCLTVTGALAGGTAGRITGGTDEHALQRLELRLLLEEDNALFLRYLRADASASVPQPVVSTHG